ncbi:MAG TPA: endonuclease NucS [Thermodesulfobacteriota bacterium]|nr:endonuclease NucS [Thermodesulfobacteriota bacterium]
MRLLIKDMVAQKGLKPGEILQREKVLGWFHDNYPKIKEGTIQAHLTKMSTNVPARIHYKVNPNGDDDLFFRIDPSRYRLCEPTKDPAPIYKSNFSGENTNTSQGSLIDEAISDKVASEFAYEKDLQSFLSKNLSLIEPGLKLYEDEGINGLEFPAGGRLIDILAVDRNNNYVVIELKVSRGYDRVVGQILRYIAWIEKNHAEPDQTVRGVIIAKEITDDLRLATSRIKDIELFEYELSVSLKQVILES